MKIYAGIGSRETPPNVLQLMTNIAQDLGPDWQLRSGGAKGADSAFAAGAQNKEIHLPWSGYNGLYANGHDLIVPTITPAIQKISAQHHPAWERLSDTVRLFMYRNTTIVLGTDIATYADMIICWTPNGRLVGGTSHAMRVSYNYDIPVFNLAVQEDINRLIAFEAESRQSNAA